MEGKDWTFITMPKAASEKLPKRGRIAIEGAINGFAFRTSAFPDGEGSHQFLVNGTMRAGAKAAVGDTASFVIQPASDTVAFEVPDDLRAALKKSAKASAQWEKITPKAKAEWATWITSSKKEETRTVRVTKTVERLTKGDKRPSD
jgi:TM2 domain-containing membrane protein YozV